jgi:adenylate cyclase
MKDQGGHPIGKDIYYFEDDTSQLRINQVTTDKIQLQFKKSTSESRNFGHTNFNYWLRFAFSNTTEKKTNQLLEIDYNNIDVVEFFSPIHLSD